WIRDGSGDTSEALARGWIQQRRIRVAQARIRIRELRRIRQVEKLRTEDQTPTLAEPAEVEREHSFQSEIHAVLPRPANNAHAAVAEVLVCKACAVRHFRSAGERR